MKLSRRLAAVPFFLCCLAVGSGLAFAQAQERVIYTSVVDKDGAPVMDLTVKDFIVREDDQAREVLRIERDTDPIQIALLVDNSAVMQSKLTDLRRALSAFIAGMRDGVEIAVITLSDRPTIRTEYTPDHDRLIKGVDGIMAFGSTGSTVIDGIYESSLALTKRSEQRSVIVAVTSDGPELSFRHYQEVLERLKNGQIALHVVMAKLPEGGQAIDRDTVFGQGTHDTGGRYDEIFGTTALEMRLKQLASELSNQYRVVFARPERLIPPKTTEVSVRNPELRARGMLQKTAKER